MVHVLPDAVASVLIYVSFGIAFLTCMFGAFLYIYLYFIYRSLMRMRRNLHNGPAEI